jgi:hypothetical protein
MGDRSRYRLYVGNVSSRVRVSRILSWFASKRSLFSQPQTRDIEDTFGKYGELRDVLLRDGFAFVE